MLNDRCGEPFNIALAPQVQSIPHEIDLHDGAHRLLANVPFSANDASDEREEVKHLNVLHENERFLILGEQFQKSVLRHQALTSGVLEILAAQSSKETVLQIGGQLILRFIS